MTAPSSIAIRIQGLDLTAQVTVIARVVSDRSDDNSFMPREVTRLMESLGLPGPGNIHAVMGRLKNKGHAIKMDTRGRWRLTPVGRSASLDLVSALDTATLAVVEGAAVSGALLGQVRHGVIGPQFAPIPILPVLTPFLSQHPFESNVFGMTRFPDDQDPEGPDPVGKALAAVRGVCAEHGLELHLASDRAISDDLWTNVAAHMWACKYGIAFFEDRRLKGVNYNLTIEVGAMLMTGRRCALLKDTSIQAMPTDLVGHIYKPVNLDDVSGVASTVVDWIRLDLGL